MVDNMRAELVLRTISLSEINIIFSVLGVWRRLEVCKLFEYLFCKLEVHNTGAIIELSSSYHEKQRRYRSYEEMELMFKQHTDCQFATYTKILEQYMSTTDHRFSQLH